MFSLYEVVRAGIGSASKLVEFQLRGMGAEGDEQGSGKVDRAPWLSQLGVTALPSVRSSLRVLGWLHGVEVWVLAAWDKARRPTDLAAGEIRFHGLEKVAAAMRILATGEIQLKAEPGQDVVVNGGGAKVGRVGDQVKVSIPANTVIVAVAMGVGTLNAAAIELTGTITAGAPNFKA